MRSAPPRPRPHGSRATLARAQAPYLSHGAPIDLTELGPLGLIGKRGNRIGGFRIRVLNSEGECVPVISAQLWRKVCPVPDLRKELLCDSGPKPPQVAASRQINDVMLSFGSVAAFSLWQVTLVFHVSEVRKVCVEKSSK